MLMRIVIIEDDASTRQELAKLLTRYGYDTRKRHASVVIKIYYLLIVDPLSLIYLYIFLSLFLFGEGRHL